MRILIAEDDAFSKTLLCELLTQWGYEIVTTQDGQEAWHALQDENAPHLAILDWMMPGIDGVEVCRRLRARTRAPYVYVILLTSRNERQDILAGMEAGADDYVTKPFDASELKVRLRAGRRIIDLQTQLLAAQEALRDQAARDPLTGIWNHGMILRTLERELDRSRGTGQPVAVLMVDLDTFKLVNDLHGHVAGDAALCRAAERLRRSVRSDDAVGRYGGDEFLVILPATDAAGAWMIAQRIHTAIATEGIGSAQEAIPSTTSIGIAAWTEHRPLSATALVQAADQALYRAKKAGRNRISAVEDDALV